MHCDESDDPLSRHVETLAFHTQRLGLQGRVTGSHLTSMHSMDNYYVSKLIPLMREARSARGGQPADQHHAAGPARQLPQAPRHDARARADGRRHQRRLRPRLRDGPVVPAGLGRHARSGADGPARGADDLAGRHARLLRRGDGEQRARARACTTTASTSGKAADCVLLQARSPIEAIRLRAHRLWVMRHGKVIARSPAVTTALDLPGRPAAVDGTRRGAERPRVRGPWPRTCFARIVRNRDPKRT